MNFTFHNVDHLHLEEQFRMFFFYEQLIIG